MNLIKQKEELAKKILEWTITNVSEIEFKESVFALCIAYDPAAEGFFGATVGIGLESERLQLASKLISPERLNRLGDYVFSELYNPAHFKNFDIPPLYKERDKIYELGENLAIENISWEDFYFELGLKLAQIDWSEYLKVTDDFVAYTTDLEQFVWEKNFMSSAPQNIRQKLFENGWLSKKMT